MRRGILIWVIAAAFVLVAGITTLALWPEGETEQDIPYTPPTGADTGDLVRAIHYEVDSVDMIPREGTPYTLKLDHENPDYTDITLVTEDALFPGMNAIMYAIYSNATAMIHLPRVAENADDGQLALYGLDTPVLTWRVNYLDGTSMEFALGLRLATGSGSYVRSTDSREVYILNDAAAAFLTMRAEDIYDILFFPYPASGEYETWDLIDHLILERPGDELIELKRRDDEEWFSSPLGISRYRFLQPFEGECSDSILKSVVLEPITNIFPDRVISVKPADLSVYGLDSPVRLTVSAPDWEGTLLIGKRDHELRGQYVMIEGHDAVLLDPYGNYGFLDIDPAQLRTQMTWVHHIDTVSSVVFELDGSVRTLVMEHPAADSEEKLNGYLDGKELGETNTRRLYGGAMSVPSSGGSGESVPDEPPVYRLTMHFLNGGSQKLEFYRISESQYLMVLDGVSLHVYTTRLQIQLNLLDRLEILDAGGDL